MACAQNLPPAVAGGAKVDPGAGAYEGGPVDFNGHHAGVLGRHLVRVDQARLGVLRGPPGLNDDGVSRDETSKPQA